MPHPSEPVQRAHLVLDPGRCRGLLAGQEGPVPPVAMDPNATTFTPMPRGRSRRPGIRKMAALFTHPARLPAP
jgi:hypothetical protein